jgi:hypothetical protein
LGELHPERVQIKKPKPIENKRDLV